MKELPLSLLSRGCGQLVPLTEGGHDGRLEVCFEPEVFAVKTLRMTCTVFRASSGSK